MKHLEYASLQRSDEFYNKHWQSVRPFRLTSIRMAAASSKSTADFKVCSHFMSHNETTVLPVEVKAPGQERAKGQSMSEALTAEDTLGDRKLIASQLYGYSVSCSTFLIIRASDTFLFMDFTES